MKKFAITLFIPLILSLFFSQVSVASTSPYYSYQTINWGSSTFYKYPDARLVPAHGFSKQTIDDMASLMRHYGYKRTMFFPYGHAGYIPNHLKDYAFYRFQQYGVVITNYAPGSAKGYHHVKRTAHKTYNWGQSTFIEKNGKIYSRHYSRKTIRDFVSLLSYLGYREVTFLGYGEKGAIPYHLRNYAYYKFTQSGIYVTNYIPR